jgi:hypothetical protein
MQMSPRPSFAMKLMASGVTCSASMARSPSFSREGSSTRMIMRPARSSARISGMGLMAIAGSGREQVRLEALGQAQVG